MSNLFIRFSTLNVARRSDCSDRARKWQKTRRDVGDGRLFIAIQAGEIMVAEFGRGRGPN